MPTMTPGAVKTPFESGMIARLTGAARVLVGSADVVDNGLSFMGPSNPPVPNVPVQQQPSVVGRQFDFPAGYNIRVLPRSGETISFATMRGLAENCDILRLVLETRKDQMAQMQYKIKFIDEDKTPDDRCKEVMEFLKMPDGENNWDDWLRQLLEEMFVTDAACIYPSMKNKGTPFRFELMDGTLMKRVLDVRGRTPAPPLPAYQQILKGITAVNYTLDEVIYRPRNKRVHKVYGYSPVEQIITTINVAIRRAIYQLQYYTEGSTPDLLFQVPADWNMNQIREFNEWWETKLSGNTAQRRKAQFVPNGVVPINTKEGVLKDDYDEWLARVICYAFSVPPTPFIKQMNRATANTAQDAALSEGLFPVMLWVKGLMDLCIWKYFGYKDLEFAWDDDVAIPIAQQTEIDDTNVKNGTKTINEIRAERGDEPVEGGDVAMALTATGYVPILPVEEPEPVVQGGTHNIDPATGLPVPVQPVAAPTQTPAKPVKAGAKGKGAEPAANEPNPAGIKGTGAGAKTGTGKSTKKIAKVRANAKMAKIDRERAHLQTMRDRIARAVFAAFQKQADAIAEELDLTVGKAANKKPKAGTTLDTTNWTYIEQLQTAFGVQLTAIASDGVIEASTQIEFNEDDALSLANADAITYAKDRAAELVGKGTDQSYSIPDATREMIRGDVTDAMEQGLSNDELAATLRDSYAFSQSRAETIARTETAFADIAGNMALYTASGVVEKKEWIVGEGCCDICAELDGQQVDLQDTFTTDDGEVDDPPAHPNCRCDILPITSDPSDDDTTEDDDEEVTA